MQLMNIDAETQYTLSERERQLNKAEAVTSRAVVNRKRKDRRFTKFLMKLSGKYAAVDGKQNKVSMSFKEA